MSVSDFDQTLDRLLLRGLVIQGQGFTGPAALYNLMDGVYSVPVRLTLFRRTAGFFRLLMEGYPFRIARYIFGPDRLSNEEKAVLKTLPSNGVANQIGFASFSEQEQRIFATEASLYLKRMVVFEHRLPEIRNIRHGN